MPQILLKDSLLSYTLTRKQVKNINLRIKRGGEICVSASKTVPLSVIEEFLQRKADWILSVLDKKQNTAAKIAENEVYLCGEVITLSPEINRQQWQKEQAALLLPAAYEKAWKLFEHDGFAKPVLRLRTMKSRWGSCIPSKGVITLNTALVGAPADCQIAVAAHELCHILHPNHSKAFYAALYQHLPDYQKQQEYLKQAQSLLTHL